MARMQTATESVRVLATAMPHKQGRASTFLSEVVVSNLTCALVVSSTPGDYFARDASYSAQSKFAAPNANGEQRMLMCRVSCGEYRLPDALAWPDALGLSSRGSMT